MRIYSERRNEPGFGLNTGRDLRPFGRGGCQQCNLLSLQHKMKTKLITREGYNKLKEELDYLWREERPEVTKKVTWAASLGDRSENADYQYNKKRLREIDRRVRYLTKSLEELRCVDYSPQQDGRVFFGAWVEIENDQGEIKRFRIVGYDEIFGRKDYISIDSPMARALLKKEVGDSAIVHTPTGEVLWYVNEIEYIK